MRARPCLIAALCATFATACGGGGTPAEVDAPPGAVDAPTSDGAPTDAPPPIDAPADAAPACQPMPAACNGNTLVECVSGELTETDCDPLWPRFCQYDPATSSSGCYECIDASYCTRPPAPAVCIGNQSQRYTPTCAGHACSYTFVAEDCPVSTNQPYCDGFTLWEPSPTCYNGTCFSGGGYGGHTCFGGCANAACNPTTGLTWTDTGYGTAAVNPVAGIYPRGPNDVYLSALWLGLEHFDGNTFTDVVGAPSGTFYGIWGSGAHLFIAGDNGAFSNPVGRFAHFDGSTWTTLTLPTTQLLSAISGTSPTDIWLVGNAGTLLHYNGTFQSYPVTTEDLSSVWAVSPSDVWAVGERDTLLHYDGMTWTSLPSGDTLRDHYDVWADATTAFVVGNRTVLRRIASSWSPQSLPVPTNAYPFRGVWGTSSSNLYIAGSNGWLLHFNGTSWTAEDSHHSGSFTRIRGASATEVYVGGANETFLVGN